MKNIFILLILTFCSSICKADHAVKIYYESIEGGYAIYADNNEFCPLSIKIDFKLTNLNVSNKNDGIHLISPNKKRQLLTKLIVSKQGKPYKFSYKYWTNYGDHKQEAYDRDFKYYLPFDNLNSFRLHQGYNGLTSHKNKNALDFTMPVGTAFTAIRGGVVVKVVEHNRKTCVEEECKKYNNIIIVYHSDGTFAEYTHLKRNGSNVKVGDKVLQGQVIGYSGNIGYSTGPHLHLVVFLQKIHERTTLKTKFLVADGSSAEYLEEKKKYSRKYK